MSDAADRREPLPPTRADPIAARTRHARLIVALSAFGSSDEASAAALDALLHGGAPASEGSASEGSAAERAERAVRAWLAEEDAASGLLPPLAVQSRRRLLAAARPASRHVAAARVVRHALSRRRSAEFERVASRLATRMLFHPDTQARELAGNGSWTREHTRIAAVLAREGALELRLEHERSPEASGHVALIAGRIVYGGETACMLFDGYYDEDGWVLDPGD